MAQLTGIGVTLSTANDEEDPGTDDHIYIGVVGTGGGREFPLNSGQEDFEPGAPEKFALGAIWEGGFIDGNTKFPLESKPGEANDPARIPLEMNQVAFVYLRKQGDNSTEGDDQYNLKDVDVVLYGPLPPAASEKRTWRFVNGGTSAKIANEHGHVIYLRFIADPTA